MKDDRGQNFRLISFKELKKSDPDDALGYHLVVDLLRTGLENRPLWVTNILWLLFLAYLFAWGLSLPRSDYLGAIIGFLFLFFAPLAVIVANISTFIKYFGKRSNLIKHTLAWYGICPSCGYYFRGTRITEDGYLCCPECGMSWHSSQVANPAATTSIYQKPEVSTWNSGLNRGIPIGYQSLQDDADHFVAVFDIRRFRQIENLIQSGDIQRVRQVKRMLDSSHRRMMLFISSLFIAYLGILVYQSTILDSMYINIVSIIIACFILIGMATRKTRTAMKALLKQEFCPSCCQDLVNVEPDQDGLVHCPRCYGVWDLRKYRGDREQDQ